MSTQAGGPSPEGRQPTEAELRAYAAQLRQAPVSQVVGEVVSALLNAAQFKLGRRDARLLLDVTAQAVETARPHLGADLARQADEAIAQLRMGQVQAERDVAAQAAVEDNDLDQPPAAAAAGPAAQPGQPPPAQPSAASKLWVPGR